MSRLFATCPHCFQTIDLVKAVFRCGSDSCTARGSVSVVVEGKRQSYGAGDTIPMRKDPLLESVWEDGSLHSHTFHTIGLVPPLPWIGRLRQRARCPASKSLTSDRLCPKCHKSLYSGFGRGPEKRLTLIGAKDSGKTSYIAVLVNELSQNVGSRFGFALPGLDGQTRETYDKKYFEPVYIHGMRVEGTDAVRNRSQSVAPLVFGLHFDKLERDATLSLFDPPGEGVILDRSVERFHHFVFNSQGLVLLVDGQKLAAPGGNLEGFQDANKVLEVAARRIEAHRSLWRAGTRPYLAIAVSKADLLRGTPELPELIWKSPRHDAGFDEQDFWLTSSEVEALLRRRGGATLCNTAQKVFGPDRVGFFLVSAYGCAPDQTTGKIPALAPFRVSDPFLWLFTRTGILGSTQEGL